jgi:serine/threonine protein kinase
MGTAPYMPPEQFMHGEVSPQSDLFGFGATLYEALAGMRPFPEGDENAIEKAKIYPQLEEDPQPLHDIIDLPEALERLVMSCLARDPARRPRTAIEAAIALETVLESLRTEELYAWPKGLRVRLP